MHVLQIGESLESRWDDYVAQKPSNVTDLSGWRYVLRDTYGIESYFFAAEERGQLIGILGLFEFRHPLFGHYLATAPFATDGGFFYENRKAKALLANEALALADDLDVDYLVLRMRENGPEGFQTDDHYQTAIIAQAPGVEALWSEVLPGKTRNQVRRGGKEGFTLHSGHEVWTDFFQVFHLHMRDLGSPVHSKQYYRNMIRHLGDACTFIVVKDGDDVAAGALLLEANGRAMNYHTVALRKYNRRCPNYLLYWHMIESTVERGCTVFDMGRSEAGSSNLKFKLNWGARAVGLKYNYYLRKLKGIPSLDPSNPRYRIPIAAWKKMPLSVTRSLGPWLIKGIA